MIKHIAKLDGITIEVESVADDFSKSVVQREYPYRDGADLVNMGAGPSSTKLRALFSGETYDSHIAFAEYIRTRSSFELVHPELGIKRGEISSVSIGYDTEFEDTVSVEFTFIEQARPAVPVVLAALGPTADTLYLETLQEQGQVLEDDLKSELGPEGSAVLNQESSQNPSLPGLVSMSGRYVISTLESAIKVMDGIGDSGNPVSSIVSNAEYAGNLSGRLLMSVARAVERIGEDAYSPQIMPSQFIRRFRSGCQAVADSVQSAIVKNQILINGAAFLAVKLAGLFESDDAARARLKQLETVKPFDDDGTYRTPDAFPLVYTINELEKAVALAREMIQEALDEKRELFSLRGIADKLVIHINKIKLERERIREVEISEVLPLHALLLRYQIPASAAERISVINNFWNPNFVTGKVLIYA